MRISIQLDQPSWLADRPLLKKTMVLMLFVGLLVIPGTVVASHQFADVPNNQPFHSEIGAIKDAGITTGSTECGTPPPGQTFYCPESFVRRDAMAAFMHRGYGRAGRGSHHAASVAPNGLPNRGAGVAMTAGGAAPAGGFAMVTASVSVQDVGPPEPCPCRLLVWLEKRDASGLTVEEASPILSEEVDSTQTASGEISHGSATQTWVFPMPTGATKTFYAAFSVVGTFSSEDFDVEVSSFITALYVPFSNDGDSTLAES